MSMSKKLLSVAFVLLICFSPNTFAQGNDSSRTYLQQKPPGDIPELFAPDIISLENQHEFGSIFSKDASEFFYAVDHHGKAEIRYTHLENGTWTTPRTILSHEIYGYNDPFLSPDENELYYISDRPFTGQGAKKDYDIWYSTREPCGWSKPINAGQNINTEKNEYYVSFTSDGTLFYASNRDAQKNRDHNFDLYSSKREDGVYQRPIRLNSALNSKGYEADVFIAPDESFLIFCAVRKTGLGEGDLYISFKNEDDSWTVAKNMGEQINTKNHELCPIVSKDGKYFFFTSNKDIYWVDAKIIDRYR